VPQAQDAFPSISNTPNDVGLITSHHGLPDSYPLATLITDGEASCRSATRPFWPGHPAVVGLIGKEGAVIRKTLCVFAYYALIPGCLGYAIVWSGSKGWLNAGSILFATSLILLIAFAVAQCRKTPTMNEADS
jgi:hypothetical protein